MAAAPQYGIFKFLGLSGRTYSVDVYLSDVANALVNFDAGRGASATSPTYYRPQEGVILTDFAIVTGMTDTTKIQLFQGNQPTGDFLRYVMHLDTLAARSGLRLYFPPNSELRAFQVA